MDIDLGQLRALAAAVDGGTFEAAARALTVTPSAISQRIRSLENSVGSVLVQRSKPITPTSAGIAYLRLARQVDALAADAAAQAPHPAHPLPSIPLAINGDSLATWVMPALAELAGELTFDIHREDQDHSAQLLRDGTVMAAITTEVQPVQGCTATRLGIMRYRPMASPAFVARWFPGAAATTDEFAEAPMVVFDRKDDIQHRYLRSRTRATLNPPRHYVPVSADFAEAVRLGFGWAMLPDLQANELESRGQLLALGDDHLDITLYWQQWALHTSGLGRVADAITRAAAGALT